MNYERSAGGIMVPVQRLLLGGIFRGQVVRNGEVIEEFEDHNLITNEGLTHALDVILHGATQVPTWYIGIFEGNYTPVATVTAATITSASTESAAYSESTRQTYVEAAAASQSTTNSASKATFTINATKTIYGAFLVSAQAKSATTGTLFAAAAFGTPKALGNGDQLLVTYTLNAASA